jgi:hypothetical protein
LPIEIIGPEPPDGDRAVGFRPELTAAGRFHPLFRFNPDEATNTGIWNELVEIYWWSECYRAKPAAEILAVHPRRPALTGGKITDSAERHPLVLQQFVGAGRTLFVGVDESWRWRFREGELRFNQFWIQMVRYLARARVGRVELRLDRQTPYRRGEPIKVTVRFPDDMPQPPVENEVRVFVERKFSAGEAAPEIEGQTLALSKVEDSRATFEGLLTRTPVGIYQFGLQSPTVIGPKPHAECKVVMPPGEMDKIQMNKQDMERAAQETQGRFYTLADADNLLPDLPPGTRVSWNTAQPPWLLWNHPIVFVGILAVLTAEWFLRKRKHLL